MGPGNVIVADDHALSVCVSLVTSPDHDDFDFVPQKLGAFLE